MIADSASRPNTGESSNDDVIENVNIEAHEVLITPEQLKQSYPASAVVQRAVSASRAAIQAILTGEDNRLLVVVGPCSIHDTEAALDYGRRLKALAHELDDSLLLVMRAYFEKPRTTVGWKGLVNDPYMNDSFRIADGLAIARQLMLELVELGLPLSTEALDPISPQYLHDLISWSAIGARTTESQTHREMASGLSSPVGFKNGTDGSLEVAINALQSVAHPHRFLGISPDGQVSVIHTKGNPYGHVVLRGGNSGPNYSADSINKCTDALETAGVATNVMVDCSHANSAKDHDRQTIVARDVVEQIVAGNRSIIGLMLESHIGAGRQDLNGAALQYGVSVTDACIGWDTTEDLLRDLAKRLESATVS